MSYDSGSAKAYGSALERAIESRGAESGVRQYIGRNFTIIEIDGKQDKLSIKDICEKTLEIIPKALADVDDIKSHTLQLVDKFKTKRNQTKLKLARGIARVLAVLLSPIGIGVFLWLKLDKIDADYRAIVEMEQKIKLLPTQREQARALTVESLASATVGKTPSVRSESFCNQLASDLGRLKLVTDVLSSNVETFIDSEIKKQINAKKHVEEFIKNVARAPSNFVITDGENKLEYSGCDLFAAMDRINQVSPGGKDEQWIHLLQALATTSSVRELTAEFDSYFNMAAAQVRDDEMMLAYQHSSYFPKLTINRDENEKIVSINYALDFEANLILKDTGQQNRPTITLQNNALQGKISFQVTLNPGSNGTYTPAVNDGATWSLKFSEL